MDGCNFEQFVRDEIGGLLRGGVMLTADRELANDLVQEVVAIEPPSGSASRDGSPGRRVQGHPTTVRRAGRTIILNVYGFRPGVIVRLGSGQGASTLADLYRIADGIRFAS